MLAGWLQPARLANELACLLAGWFTGCWLAAAKIENAGLQLAIENIALSVLGLLVLAIFDLLEAAAAVLEAALAG